MSQPNPPNIHRFTFDSVIAGRVYHLPNDTIRMYYEDDSYVERPGIVATMALAGYVELGDEVPSREDDGMTWRVYVPTDLGRQVAGLT